MAARVVKDEHKCTRDCLQVAEKGSHIERAFRMYAEVKSLFWVWIALRCDRRALVEVTEQCVQVGL